MHPCIQASAIFDMSNPCHQAAMGGAAGVAAAAKLESTMDMTQCPLATLKLPES